MMEAGFVLLGVLSLCGLSFGEGCDGHLRKNYDFPGSDIAILFSPDAEHCQHLCTQHSSCLFFAFIGPECTVDNRHFHCFLKSTHSGKPQHEGPKQGTTCGFSLRSCSPDLKPCLPQVYQNVDFYGADYQALFTADYAECQRACTDDPACQFFTFINSDFAVTYLPDVPSEWLWKPLRGINLPGSDIRPFVVADADACERTCTEDSICQFYSFALNQRLCYHKRVITMPAPGKVTRLVNAVSGFSLRNCHHKGEA